MLGNGDCCVIKTPGGKCIIIDGGNNVDYDYGKNVVIPYLLDRKITKIDYLMISHFDSDHCGGLFAVLENLKVDKIIIGKQLEEYDNYKKFAKLAKSKKVKIIAVEAGNKVKIEKYVDFDFIWPDSKKMISDNGINNNSMVAKLNYKNFSCIFTGDIEEIAEKQILEKYENNLKLLKSDILKVGHHGSKSSSVQEIVDKISPKISVISVGEKNKYGHPNKDVISRLENIRK